MREAVIVSTARTATDAPVLAGHVMNAAVDRAGIDPSRIDDVFWGAANQWGTQAGNLGRMGLFAGALPNSVPAFSLDRKCGSGLTAIALAARTIMCGEAEIALAGGAESVSLTVTKDALRAASRFVTDNQPAAYIPMIETAEIVAERYSVSRESQDLYAAESQRRAALAASSGLFDQEIVPITVERNMFDNAENQIGIETITLSRDEGIRPETTFETLRPLKPFGQGANSLRREKRSLLVTQASFPTVHRLKS